jgi:hypothetical protein
MIKSWVCIRVSSNLWEHSVYKSMHTCISMGAPNRTCTQILSIASVCPLLSLSLSLTLWILKWWFACLVHWSIGPFFHQPSKTHELRLSYSCALCAQFWSYTIARIAVKILKMMTKHVSLMLESSEANIKKSSSDKTVCKTAVTFCKNVFHR